MQERSPSRYNLLKKKENKGVEREEKNGEERSEEKSRGMGKGRGRGWGKGGVGSKDMRGAEQRTVRGAEKRDSGNILFCVGTISYGLEYNYYERMTLGTCFTSGKFTLT